MKKDTLLLSNVHNEQHVANHQLNAIVLNASQEQAMPHPKEDGGFYVSATACRSNRPETGQYYLFYDASCQEIHYTHHTKDDYKQAILHSHPGLSRGNIGEVQLSAGSGIFKSHAFLTYDDVNHLFKIGDTTMHTFVMDATTGKFTSGKLRPHAGKQDFEVDHSNLYLHLLDS